MQSLVEQRGHKKEINTSLFLFFYNRILVTGTKVLKSLQNKEPDEDGWEKRRIHHCFFLPLCASNCTAPRARDFFFFFFLGPHLQHMKVPRRGLNGRWSCQPTPQQLGIPAAPETCAAAHSNTDRGQRSNPHPHGY